MRRFRALLGDRSGNVAIMAAVSATVLIGVTAFAVDTGKMFIDRRRAQSITDLAALAGASSPANAALLASGTVSQNGVTPTEPLSVLTGNYVADPAVASGSRFVAAPAATADAVQVTLATRTSTYFAGILGASDGATIRTTATAASTAIASFAVGSRLASLNEGIINQLLGSTLGGKISLSVMDYRALADLRIDAFDYLDAIATRARITGPTYDSVLDGDVALGDALHALVDVASADPKAKTATVGLLVSVQRAATSAATLNLGEGIDLGPYGKLSINEHPRTSVSLSALDILNTTARLADGTNQAAAGIGLDVPQLASVNVKVTVGERPVTGFSAVGRPGATAETAQTRILLDVRIAPVGLGLVSLPIYIDVAKAKAVLSAVSCPGLSSVRKASLAVTPAIVEAWIGSIPDREWTSMSPNPNPSAAKLVNLGLVSLTGKAHVRMGNEKPQKVAFSSGEIDAATIKTVETNNFLTSLTGSLIGDLEIGVSAGGLGIVLPAQKKLLTDALSSVSAPVDGIINTLLAFLGVGLGEADVWVDGLRCDDAVLVR